MRVTAVLVVLIMALGISAARGTAGADEALTLTLEPEPGSRSDLRLNHETLGASRHGASKQYRAQTQNGQAKSKEVVIGRVGTITASKVSIKSAPSKRSRTLYKCTKDTYLAIVGENGGWYGILMMDSSTGWVEKKHVALLDYQVVGQASQSAPTDRGKRIVNTALKYLGIPYRWGGYSFGGLDCSGFVKAVFASNGIDLPRVSGEQVKLGMPIGWGQLQPGDRLYFACKGAQIDHAGIYLGNGLFIHSSSSRGGVAVDSVLSSFYCNSLIAARRS